MEELIENQENNNLSKKERRELRRRERDASMGKQDLKKKGKKFIFWCIIIVIVAGVLWGIVSFVKAVRAPGGALATLGQDYSHEVAFVNRDHVAEGTHVTTYNSNPPTSGPHWPDAQLDGVYDKVIPDEGMVHALEHGRVWISYKPSIPDSAKEVLRRIGSAESLLVVSERPSNDADIALAAWQRLDTFNIGSDGKVDEKRIYDFIARYRNHGPENVPMMVGKKY